MKKHVFYYPISRTQRGGLEAQEIIKLHRNIRKEREAKAFKIMCLIAFIAALIIVYISMQFGG